MTARPISSSVVGERDTQPVRDRRFEDADARHFEAGLPPWPVRDERLRRASTVATSLGVLVLAAALGLQFFAPRTLADLGQGGSLALRIAGVGLVIAGWVLGRARRR